MSQKACPVGVADPSSERSLAPIFHPQDHERTGHPNPSPERAFRRADLPIGHAPLPDQSSRLHKALSSLPLRNQLLSNDRRTCISPIHTCVKGKSFLHSAFTWRGELV